MSQLVLELKPMTIANRGWGGGVGPALLSAAASLFQHVDYPCQQTWP